MKRVTQVLYSGLGGHGSVAFSLLEGDIEHRVKHQIVFFGIEPVKEEYIEKCEQNSVLYSAVIIQNMSKLKALVKAFFAIKKQQPDSIILHSTALFPIIPLFRLMGIKVISVDHTPNATKTRMEWLSIKLLRYFSNIQVYLTKEQYDDYSVRFGTDFHKTGHPVIINNGIDTQRFSRESPYVFNAPFRLMMQARFSQTKDFQTIIRAVKILQEQDLPKFHVYLAGDGETWVACKQLAEELDVEDSITFLGMQPESVLIQYLQQSHLYIHSTLSETMSTAIMQALSCGLPCLVSDIPGNQSLIKEGKNGWFFATKDQKDLAEKIKSFLSGKASADVVSRNARKYAEEHLSMVGMFNNYFKFI